MGLGFSLVAKRPKRLVFGVFSKETDWRDAIESAILSHAESLGLAFLIGPPAEAPDRIAAHYCEEWLDFTEIENKIVLQARTSTCGPGYHAFLIDVLDILKQTMSLTFDEDGEHFDETGYFRARDFDSLQEQHADWLGGLARHVVKNAEEGATHQLISLATDSLLPSPPPGEVLTPHGPIPLSVLSRMGMSDGGQLLEYASRWFPWWNRVASTHDLVRSAKSIMWVDVPWHVPAGDNERHAMEAALKSCVRAKSLDAAVDIPTRELAELSAFLAEDASMAARPSAHGIGYRRQVCTRWLGSGWSIEIPGYWYGFEDEDGSGLTFAGQVIWVSSYSVDKKPGHEKVPIDLTQVKSDEMKILEIEEGLFRLRMTKLKVSDTDEGFTYSVQATRPDGLLVLTLAGDDSEWETDLPRLARSVNAGRIE